MEHYADSLFFQVRYYKNCHLQVAFLNIGELRRH